MDDTLDKIRKILERNHCHHIPVVEDNRLVGIVTRGDVRGAEPSDATSLSIWEINYLLAKLKVERIMTTNPLTTSPEATIESTAKIMLDHKVSGLPVVNNQGEVLGIITESDIFRLVVKTWDTN